MSIHAATFSRSLTKQAKTLIAVNNISTLEYGSLICSRRFAGGIGLTKVRIHRSFSANATTAETTNGGRNSFLQWYEGHLQRRPVLTKMITGALLWGLGDGVAQVVPRLAASDGDSSESEPYDIVRTARAAFYGFAIHAPLSHVHFNFLEWLTIRTGVKGLGIPLFKAFMEQVGR
jgi:hypothetical protein